MEATVALLSYLLGSIPSGFIVGKMSGLDVRTAGSGNIGATNVARLLGRGRGFLTLLADAAKGFVPVLVAQQLNFSDAATALVAAAAFLGHLYPAFLRFKGGKGVATALGALLASAPVIVLALLGIFGAVVAITRLVSLASMIAALAAPFLLWLFFRPTPLVALAFFFAAMIILRHRANISRLMAGTEPRFGESANSR
jgi:acyl phosphate:glycerol-3-phosphate acyltransferase